MQSHFKFMQRQLGIFWVIHQRRHSYSTYRQLKYLFQLVGTTVKYVDVVALGVKNTGFIKTETIPWPLAWQLQENLAKEISLRKAVLTETKTST